MSKEIGRDFVPEIGKSLDHHIKKTGLDAARATLPNFQWDEIKERLRTVGVATRRAALILKMEQQTQEINLVMATKMITAVTEDARELEISADGNVKLIPFDQTFWDNNLNGNNPNNN